MNEIKKCTNCGEVFIVKKDTKYFKRNIRIISQPNQKVFKWLSRNGIMERFVDWCGRNISIPKYKTYIECDVCYEQYLGEQDV